MKFGVRELIELIILAILVIPTIIYWEPIIKVSTNVNELRDFILRFGILSSIAFIVFTAIQVIIPPIPGQIAGLAGGYIYGTVLGTFYSMIGLFVGSYIIFASTRKYGRPFIEKMISKNKLKKFDKLLVEKGSITMFIAFLIPIFPDDILCYLAGLTTIKMRTLLLVSMVGRFPKFLAFNLIGSGIYHKDSFLVITLSAALIIISLAAYIFKDKLKNLITNRHKRKTITRDQNN